MHGGVNQRLLGDLRLGLDGHFGGGARGQGQERDGETFHFWVYSRPRGRDLLTVSPKKTPVGKLDRVGGRQQKTGTSKIYVDLISV